LRQNKEDIRKRKEGAMEKLIREIVAGILAAVIKALSGDDR